MSINQMPMQQPHIQQPHMHQIPMQQPHIHQPHMHQIPMQQPHIHQPHIHQPQMPIHQMPMQQPQMQPQMHQTQMHQTQMHQMQPQIQEIHQPQTQQLQPQMPQLPMQLPMQQPQMQQMQQLPMQQIPIQHQQDHKSQEQTDVHSINSMRPSFFTPYASQQPVQPPTRNLNSNSTSTNLPDSVQNNGEKDLVYQAFELYFNYPKFIKVNDVHDSYSLYYSRVKSMINEFRYLIITTASDYLPKGTIMKLNELPWKSFQLRILDKEIDAPETSYHKQNNGVFDDEIILQKRDKLENKVIYQCKYNPLTVELLPSKKGSIHDYPDKSTLESAMDTFNCVIYFS